MMTAWRRLGLPALGFLLACGHSGGAEPTDATTHDAATVGDASVLDAHVFDATRAGDARARDAAPDGLEGGEPPADALPATFFAMSTNTRGASHVPSVPFSGLRLWDTTAVWPGINTSSGVYDFTELDAWLAEAAAAGVDVIFTFGRTPTWASMRPAETCGYGLGCAAPPSDVGTGDTILRSFTTALVNHSVASTTAHIKYYEIWNEPDLAKTWTGTAAQLVTMAKDISELVHSLDSTARVVGPAPSTGNRFGIHFLPSYYDAGGATYDDIVGMHAYLYDGSDFATVPEGILDTINQLKLLMTANGVGDKTIFFTEGAWGGAPNNSTMTDDQKVAYLARDYLLMWMNGIGRFYWYAWDNPTFGTLFDGSIQPPGTAYGILDGWLVGSTHGGDNCSQDAGSTWTCSLTLSGGSPALILWNPSDTPSVSVPSTYMHYLTLDDTTVHDVSSSAVTVGPKPILVTY